ncbi:MAG: hypothetical protein ACOCV2_00945, partial [Persicimonas sp.]
MEVFDTAQLEGAVRDNHRVHDCTSRTWGTYMNARRDHYTLYRDADVLGAMVDFWVGATSGEAEIEL